MPRHLVLPLLFALLSAPSTGFARSDGPSAPPTVPPTPPAAQPVPTVPSDPAAPPPATPVPAADRLIALPVATASLDVQSTGAEPKVALRPALRAGDAWSIDFSTEGLVTRFGEGVPRHLDRPLTVRWALDMRVEQVAETGAATIAATVRSATLEPHPSNPATQVASTGEAVSRLKGRTMTLDLSPDGALAGARVPADALGPEAAPSPEIARLAEVLAMLFRPLPQMPVGKGARWQARTDRKVEGIDRIEVVTTTLDAVEPTNIRASLTTVVRPQRDRARVADERMPGNRLVSIAQLTGSGGGTARWNGTRYLPTALREQILLRLVLEGVAKDEPNDNGPRRYLEEQVLVGVRVTE